MACKSMLAKRIVLWYILIGSFVILPLTLNVGLGCRFLNVGVEENNAFQSFGAFNVAIYDPNTRVGNQFLGCVSLSQFWKDETDHDIGFTTIRIASAFMLGFTSLATLICICLQCFTKSSKSHMWRIMRFFYFGALISQGAMFSVFASDMCKADDESNPKCTPGRTGMAGVFNFLLLLGMVISSLVSFPPRNPVFQCWGGDIDDLSEEGSTESEEDEVMRKFKALSTADVDADESVSLFGGSRMSRKSKRSSKSSKSILYSANEKDDDAASSAERGLSSVSVGSSKRSQKSKRSKTTATIPSKFEKSVSTEDESIKSAKSRKSAASHKSVKSAVESVKSAVDTVKSVGSGSVSTTKSSQSKKLMPGVKKYLGKKKSLDSNGSILSAKSSTSKTSIASVEEIRLKEYLGKKKSLDSSGSILSAKSSTSKASIASVEEIRPKEQPQDQDLNSKGSLLDLGLNTLSSASGSTLEVTNFVLQLIAMTEVKEGGRRIEIEDIENQVEIIDEYPKVPGGAVNISPGHDIVAVRTEYYDLGSRTTKEITHSDGSKTILTTIVVHVAPGSTVASGASRQERQKPLEPPSQMDSIPSAGSIESAGNSKYHVLENTNTSVTSYKGSGKKKELMGEGDLNLSVTSRK